MRMGVLTTGGDRFARGGTILDSSRVQPSIGGEGTLKAARPMSDSGLPVPGVPKTLAATTAKTGGTVLQLADLHGDMGACGDLQHGLVNLLGGDHPDRVRQPSSALGEPGHELVCAASRVGPDQRAPSAPVLLRLLGQGEPGDGDVVGCGVAARVPGPQQGGHGLPSAAVTVVDKAHTSTPPRSTVTCPPAFGAAALANFQTDSRTSDRAALIAVRALGPAAARVAINRETVGSDATRPKTAGSLRSIPASARQSPPSATARATSSRAFPGSCSARGRRHGAGAADIAWSSPVLRQSDGPHTQARG